MLVDHEEVVEIAAHLARRDHAGRQIDARIGDARSARQHAELNPPPGLELTRSPGFLELAFLQCAPETASLAFGFGEVAARSATNTNASPIEGVATSTR